MKNIQSLKFSRKIIEEELREQQDWLDISLDNMQSAVNDDWWRKEVNKYIANIADLKEALRILNQYH